MDSNRSRRLRGSLGDSWGHAEYDPSDSGSVHSVSDHESPFESDDDLGSQDRDHEATLVSQRDVRPTSNYPSSAASGTHRSSHAGAARDIPMKSPASRASSRRSPLPGTAQSQGSRTTPHPTSRNLEPSLIMPHMSSPNEVLEGSTREHTRVRARNERESSNSMRATTMNSTSATPRGTRKARRTGPQQETDSASRSAWYVVDQLHRMILWPAMQYVLSVGGHALLYLRPVLSAVFALWLIGFLLAQTSYLVRSSLQTALAPICSIPGSTYLVPFCSTIKSHKYRNDSDEAFDIDELLRVQTGFEDVLDVSKDNYYLPRTMKNSEAAIRDIKTLVKWSKLPSRTELEVEFDAFISIAKELSGDLIKYNTKIGNVLDKVINTNKWTLRMLQGWSAEDASRGIVGRIGSSLNPFQIISGRSLTLQEKLYDHYAQHVGANKAEIDSLIAMAQSLLYLLQESDAKLDVISDLAARDNMSVSKNRDELLSQLWTKLGGNSGSRKGLDKQLLLLTQVQSYRREAMKHVSGTLLKLQEIAAGMESLRERIAEPEVLGFRGDIPMEYHIENVETAIDRLLRARGEAQRLERQAFSEPLRELDEGFRALPAGKEAPVVTARARNA